MPDITIVTNFKNYRMGRIKNNIAIRFGKLAPWRPDQGRIVKKSRLAGPAKILRLAYVADN